MQYLEEARVGFQPLDRFQQVIGDERMQQAMSVVREIRRRLARRVFWNVNSTAVGGGVAEMLQSLLGYARASGIDARWMVVQGNPDFFRVTKRLHNALHGTAGDGTALDDEARGIYEDALRGSALELASIVRPGDIVLLHDPQTAGLAPYLLDTGAHVVWRCHIGTDSPSPEAEAAWAFLKPYLEPLPIFVFSRQAYVPVMCDHGKARIIQPSIDAFSPKNQKLDEPTVRAILAFTGLVEADVPDGEPGTFVRDDGSPMRVGRRAEVTRLGRPPAVDTPLIVQVSRWDRLKDPVGVIEGFGRLVASGGGDGAELVMAGPDVRAVADDPEGVQVLEESIAMWRELPDAVRDRIHLACLPTDDVQENAAIVNALQSHAAIVVQKSLQEGFGLTVTEAMWKRRPVVASAVGGIQDQIEDGISGLLLKDPTDLDDFAALLADLLRDPERAARIGTTARDRVRDQFLGVGHLLKYAKLVEELDS